MEEKHPQTIAAVGEFEFPGEIIHQIQSFMDEREAAGTTLVSKSWYGAWSTRFNLSFDQNQLRERLPEYARKTLQRYEDLNLNIQTFHLRMHRDDSDVARELILKAIKLGAIDLAIQVMTRPAFVLPDEVLESQTLATLSVEFVRVDLGRMINKPIITSSNLKSLTLHWTAIKSESSELWLQFACLKTLVIRDCYFKPNGTNVFRIRSPSLECVTIRCYWFRNIELEFDVPNIRKLELDANNYMHLLEMKASGRERESYIYITCLTSMVCASWLRLLKHFVEQLSPSRVSLTLYTSKTSPLGVEDGFVGDGLAIPAVENLTIRGSRVAPACLNALFWSCRPNFVDIQRRCVGGIQKENVEQFQHLSSLPWNTLLDDSRDDFEEEFVRFQLK